MTYIGEPYDESYFHGNRDEGYTDYASINPAHWVAIADDIEAQIGPVSGLDTLDLGCGFGFLANELANRGAIVQGVDISSYAIAQAQSRFPSLTFIQTDAVLGLPFKVNYFRLVVAVGVTDCMPDEAALDILLDEVNRVLHPQGKGYILGSTTSDDPYFVKTPEQWNNKVIGGRDVVSEAVGHMLPWDTRVVVS